MKNTNDININIRRNLLRLAGLLPLLLLAGLLDCVQTAGAATTINWANPVAVSQTTISSTNGQSLLYVPSNPYAVGDLIYFTGTTAANNPFSTSATRYYVISSSGNNIQVATTFNGTALNAANSITAAALASKHPDWLAGGNWTGGSAPIDNSHAANVAGAGGGATPPGGVCINGNVTTYGLTYNGSSQDLAVYSGSSGSSLYALTFATSDSTTPKITLSTSAGVVFLGNSSQAASLKISGTQGLIFNSLAGGAITGSGTGATSTGPGSGKDTRVYASVDWSGLSGGIQIERGQVSQQNGTSTLGLNQNLTVGNAQTLANNLIAGFELNGKDCTIDALNGNSLGRIYSSSAQSIFKVGNNNGSGTYSGCIGANFGGNDASGNVWLHKAGSGTQTISGPISQGAGNTTVTVDAGTLILSGTNTYSGATTIATGSKLVGVAGGSCSNSTVTINNTAGCVLGVLVTNNTMQWSCGNLVSAGTSASLEFAFAATPSTSVAPLNVTTNLTFTGTPSIVLDPANLSAGTYPLIQVGGTAPSGVPAVTIVGGRGMSATAAWGGTGSKTLSVTVSGTSTEPLTWNSSGTGTWDVNNSANAAWKDAGGSTTNYQESLFGDQVQFTDTGLSADTAVTLNTSVNPFAMTVNNSTYQYTISGSGAIAGTVGLTKSGSQTLTISNANTFTGNFAINAGTVRVGNPAALGVGATTIGASGKLDLNGQTIANAIATVTGGALLTNSSASAATVSTAVGSSSASQVGNFTVGTSGNITLSDVFAANGVTLTKAGAGTLTLGGANNNNVSGGNPMGGVTVNAGVVVLAKTGSATVVDGVTINSGGTLQMDPTHTTTGWQTWAGQLNSGVTLAGGTLDLNGVTGKNNLIRSLQGTGLVTNSSSTPAELQFTTRDSATVVYSGTIADGPGAGKVSVNFTNTGSTGSGRINVFSGTNTYSGDTAINFATLELGSVNAVQNSTVNLAATAGLGANASPLEFTNGITAFTIGGLKGGQNFILTNLDGNPVVLSVGNNNGSTTYSGAMSGSGGIIKIGTGTFSLTGANTFTGNTVISNGTLIAGTSLAGAVTVVGPGVLNATNSPTISGAMTLSGTNATVSLLDGNIGYLYLNNGLTLNNSNVLKFEISGSSMDQISVSSGSFAQSGKAIINVSQLTPPNPGTYTLISGVSGISAANFVLGNSLSGYALSLTDDGSNLYLVVGLNAPATAYWNNHVNTVWTGHSGTTYNWDTDQSSGINANAYPAASSDVFFAANGAGSFSTTLGADFIVKSLTYVSANNVTIAGTTNSLTLNGALSVNSGAGANSTISVSNLVLGVDQNLNISDSGTTLTVSSRVTGAHALNVNASGSGTLVLSGTNNYSGGTTINSGTLAVSGSAGALPAGGSVNVNGGTLNIGAVTNSVGAVTLTSGSITGISGGLLNGSSFNLQNGTETASLGGSGAMTVNGGSVLLAGTNSSYSGGTTISSGTLQLGSSNALGSGSVTIGNTTTLDLNGQIVPNAAIYSGGATLANNGASAAAMTANATVNGNITIDTTGGDITVARLIASVTRSLTKTGSDTLTLNGAGHNNLIQLIAQAGTVVCANNGGYSADRGVQIYNGATVKLAGSGSGGSYPNANLINDTGAFDIDGTFDLNGWNETVDTLVGGGGNGLIENTAVGTNSTLTIGAAGTTAGYNGIIQDGGGILSLTKSGAGVQSLSGTCTYSGNTTINAGQLAVTALATATNSTFIINAANGLVFSSDTAFVLGGLAGTANNLFVNDSSSAVALTVGGNNASTTYSGALLDSGAGSTLTKIGSGSLTLSGTNNYSGLTTINKGALVISPNYTAGYDFTVNEGAVFGVSGNTPSTSAQVGTLNCGISGSGTSTLYFSSLPVATNAPLTVGTLNPVGGSSSIIISNTAAVNVGTYNLINYTTLGGVGFSAFGTPVLPAGVVAHLVNNTAATPKVIQLVVTAVAPQIWSGAVNTNWDIAATANWKLNSVSTNYNDGSPALFDDTATGVTTVNLATNVQPSSLTVSNNTKSYTFTTANNSAIAGSTAFTKNGTGTVTLVNLTNSFTGGVAINAGAVVLSSASFAGNGIVDNASLVFSNGTQVAGGNISGTGVVVQNGSGSVELAGTNTFSGGLLIQNGIVQSDSASALGVGTVTLGDGVSANSAKLLAPNTGGNFSNTNPITIAAGGTGTYTIQYVGNPDYHLTGGITLNNGLTFSVTANGAIFVDAPLTSGTGNPAVTIDGGGSTTKFVYLTANNSATFTGNIIVTNSGKIKSGNANSLSAANAISFDGSSSLDNGSQALTIAGLNDYGAGGGSVFDAGGATLTVAGSGSYSFSGVISLNGSLLKNGSGTQTFTGVNTYTGSTVVSNGTLVVNGSLAGGAVTVAGGTLSGTGILNGATTVQSGGTVSPGGNGIGTLTISNSLTLAGNTVIQLNKSLAQSNDVVNVSGTLAYGGTLSVTNLGGSLVAGDSFRIFKSGGTGSVSVAGNPGTGLNFSFSDGLLSVVNAGPSGPATLTNSVSGSTLSLSWPAGQGWMLQAQTNNLSTGLGTNWTDVPGSTGLSSTNITIDPTRPTVFYRLKY